MMFQLKFYVYNFPIWVCLGLMTASLHQLIWFQCNSLVSSSEFVVLLVISVALGVVFLIGMYLFNRNYDFPPLYFLKHMKPC